MELTEPINSLLTGEVSILGQIPWGSNYTFLAEIEPAPHSEPKNGKPKDSKSKDEPQDEPQDEPSNKIGTEIFGIYKPIKGERPLWDFPPNLAKRERAAFLLSEQLGWGLVPPTIIREGPLGKGSLQLFIDAQPQKHYLNFTQAEYNLHQRRLKELCTLDIVINSTDRKSGHILVDKSDKIWAIDNGLSFHSDFKLRTVLWDFGGQAIPKEIISKLVELVTSGLDEELKTHLEAAEISATIERAKWLAEGGVFPEDPGGYYSRPWPL